MCGVVKKGSAIAQKVEAGSGGSGVVKKGSAIAQKVEDGSGGSGVVQKGSAIAQKGEAVPKRVRRTVFQNLLLLYSILDICGWSPRTL